MSFLENLIGKSNSEQNNTLPLEHLQALHDAFQHFDFEHLEPQAAIAPEEIHFAVADSDDKDEVVCMVNCRYYAEFGVEYQDETEYFETFDDARKAFYAALEEIEGGDSRDDL